MALRFWKELVERRVPHVVGLYLAAGWGLLEFTSWAADRALVASGLVDAMLIGWLVLLPLAAALAWRAPLHRLTRPERGDAPALAVLPFENLSGDPQDAYLSDALADELTTALTRVPGLRVASRTSTRAALRRESDLRAVGLMLGADSVLEGAVQRAGDQLRVRTRLVGTGDGYQLWARRYDATMADVFQIQDEIAASVARTVETVLRPGLEAALRPAPRTVIQAYEYYLRGRQYFFQTRRKSLQYAASLFRRAIEIDATYAPAHASLAQSVAVERLFYPEGGDLAEAERASLRALELDPELPEARSARGAVLFVSGRLDEAEQAFEEAIRLDPRLFDAHYLLARIRFQQGRFADAAALFEAAAAVRADYQAEFFRAQAYEAMGREREAKAAYRDALERTADHMELNPDDARAATMRAVAACRIGRLEEGLGWGRRAIEIDPDDGGVLYNVACLYAVVGEAEASLDALHQALARGFGNPEWLANDPDLAPLRGDPRFQALMAAHRPPPAPFP